MATETTIIIADDHPIFRQGVKQIIEKEFGFRVIADAEDGRNALEIIKTQKPMVAVLDMDMPELDGFSVVRYVQEKNLPVKIIILTMHKDELHFNQAIDLGVSGYVIKDSAVYEVVNCIKSVVKNEEYFSTAVSSFLLKRSRRSRESEQQSGFGDLTPTLQPFKFDVSTNTCKQMIPLCRFSSSVQSIET